MKYTIELEDYEVSNLKSVLLFAKDVGGDTGDWYNQVLFKLPPTGIPPNKAPSELRRELACRAGYQLLFRG